MTDRTDTTTIVHCGPGRHLRLFPLTSHRTPNTTHEITTRLTMDPGATTTLIGTIITKFHRMDTGRESAAASAPANPHLRIPPPAPHMTTTTPTDRQMT